MQNKSPETDIRAALRGKGVSGAILEGTIRFLEEEDYLDELAGVEEGYEDYKDHLVDVGVREARRLEEFPADAGVAAVSGQRAPSGGVAEGYLWLLLQQLVVEDVRNSPPVRNWRRQHLGGPDAVLTHDEAEPWILKNTTDWDPGSPHRVPSEPFIWHLFGDPLIRGVPEESPVYSLRELTKPLADKTGWHERDATIWVLTDRLPPASGLSVGVKYRDFGLTPTMVIEVSPLVSERTLLIWYREIRQRLLGGRRPAPSRKVLEMARFVLDNPTLSWKNRLSQWNAAHPDSPYNNEPNMKRMYFGLLRRLQSTRGPELRRFSTRGIRRSTAPTP